MPNPMLPKTAFDGGLNENRAHQDVNHIISALASVNNLLTRAGASLVRTEIEQAAMLLKGEQIGHARDIIANDPCRLL